RLQVKLAPTFEHVLVAQPGVGRFADLDVAGSARAFDVPGDVYGLAPEVIAEFGLANHTRHHRPRIDADAQAEGLSIGRVVPRDFLLQREGSFGDGFGVVGTRHRHSR